MTPPTALQIATVDGLPPEAIRFATEQCLPRVRLLNAFRQARYLATAEKYVRGRDESTVDRTELFVRRNQYTPAAAIEQARAELSELADAAIRNGVEPASLIRIGLRLAREQFRSSFAGRTQWLGRGYGPYPSLGLIVDRKRAEATANDRGGDEFRLLAENARIEAEVERDREQQLALLSRNRRRQARQIRQDRQTQKRLWPKLRPGQRIGRPVHPATLMKGDMVLQRDVDPYGVVLYFSHTFLRMNRCSWSYCNQHGYRCRHDLRDDSGPFWLIRGKTLHPIRITARPLSR